MEQEKLSPAMQILSLIWKETPYDSHRHLNSTMQSALGLVISAGIKFELNDFDLIFKKFRAGYWLGVSANGHHYGDWQYGAACRDNQSASLAYEAHFKRIPFILDGKRVYTNMTFIYEGLYCNITGWTQENDKINIVGYSDGWDKGKRKLMSFDKKQWLEVRKAIII